jgi:uncharacterized protein YhaN|tara:strand:+ start:1418 stop:2146 length:729 start_codon:yes stop_codon:yes gene_type:complete
MTLPSLFRYQAFDDSGRPVPGALVSFRQGSRSGPVFLDPELRTEARNPFPAKAGGRVTLYLHAGESYEVTITSPRGQILDQFVHTGQAIGETVTETVVVPEPVEVEKVVYRDSPETLAEMEALRKANAARDAEAAMMANLEKLEAADAKLKERPPEPEPEPEAEIAPDVEQVLNEAGVYKSDTPEKVNEVLLRKLNEAKQCHYIALEHGGSFNGGNSVYWEQKAERYQTGVDWNRGRMAETL